MTRGRTEGGRKSATARPNPHAEWLRWSVLLLAFLVAGCAFFVASLALGQAAGRGAYKSPPVAVKAAPRDTHRY